MTGQNKHETEEKKGICVRCGRKIPLGEVECSVCESSRTDYKSWFAQGSDIKMEAHMQLGQQAYARGLGAQSRIQRTATI